MQIKTLSIISKDRIRFDAVTNDPVSQWLLRSVCFSLMVCIH